MRDSSNSRAQIRALSPGAIWRSDVLTSLLFFEIHDATARASSDLRVQFAGHASAEWKRYFSWGSRFRTALHLFRPHKRTICSSGVIFRLPVARYKDAPPCKRYVIYARLFVMLIVNDSSWWSPGVTGSRGTVFAHFSALKRDFSSFSLKLCVEIYWNERWWLTNRIVVAKWVVVEIAGFWKKFRVFECNAMDGKNFFLNFFGIE